MRTLLVHARSISNERTAFAFWTTPNSNILTGTRASAAPLGIITVAALLPDAWELRLVDLEARELVDRDWDWADIVMVSANLAQRDSMLELISEAKMRDKKVVVGGPYPTSVPKELLDRGADFLVLGEGEGSIPEFLRAIERGETRGVFTCRERVDMAASPIPRYDLLTLSDYRYIPVQTSRGCPHDCEFCDIVHLFGSVPRYKTLDQVMKELETIYSLGHRGQVLIADDNFIANKKHTRAIAEKLVTWQQERGEPFGFMCQVTITLGNDLPLIELLTRANIYIVFIGIETPHEEVLRKANKRHNLHSPMGELIATMNKNGLVVVGSFVIGFDGEQEGMDRLISAFVEQCNMPLAVVNLLDALPGSRLWNRLESEGRLLGETITSDRSSGDRLNFAPTRPQAQIFEEHIRAWEYLYEPSRYLNRTCRYFCAMCPKPKATAKRADVLTTPARRRSPFPWRSMLRDLRTGLLLFLWQGVLARSRLQFWKNLLTIIRTNPSRLDLFLVFVGWSKDLFQIREALVRRRDRNGQ